MSNKISHIPLAIASFVLFILILPFGNIYQKIAVYDEKDGMSMKEVTKDSFGTRLRKKAAAVSVRVYYSGFIVLALLPTIYGSDWPERGWC